MYKLLYMDIYNSYKAGKAHHKEIENVNKNNSDNYGRPKISP